MRSFAATVSALKAAQIPVQTIRADGYVALSTNGARLIGLSVGEGEENILYTHPRLNDRDLVVHHPEELAAGIGGDRLWFSPELRYHWRGAPDWVNFSNNSVPRESDPGDYDFVDVGPGALGVVASITLPTTDGSPEMRIEVARTVTLAPPPSGLDSTLLRNVQCVGVNSEWRLELNDANRTGRVALWHILQAQIGSRALIPLREPRIDEPLLYTPNVGGWALGAGHLTWRFEGSDNAKVGLGAQAVTGRVGLLRKLSDGRACLILREFPVHREGAYGDHPHHTERDDQVLQLWDGFGFGEIEYHSRFLDGAVGPRVLEESDTIWALLGAPTQIVGLVMPTLGIELGELVLKELE